jgi:hypothetical protein
MGELAGLRKAETLADLSTDIIFATTYGNNARVLFPADAGNLAVWFRDDDVGEAAAIFAVVAGQVLVGDIVGIDASGTTVTSATAGW